MSLRRPAIWSPSRFAWRMPWLVKGESREPALLGRSEGGIFISQVEKKLRTRGQRHCQPSRHDERGEGTSRVIISGDRMMFVVRCLVWLQRGGYWEKGKKFFFFRYPQKFPKEIAYITRVIAYLIRNELYYEIIRVHRFTQEYSCTNPH